MAYQYKLTWTDIPDNMVEEETYNQDSIKKGDRFYCTKDVVMNPSGDITYVKFKTYVSEEDGCITSEGGNRHHGWDDPNWREFFIPAPHPVEKCNCDKCEEVKDKDYFQSMQEEYGRVNFVQDASTPPPEPGDFELSTASGEYIPPTGTELLIAEECENLKNLLIEKNRRYGDSAINRGQIYDIPATVAIKARINDKLLRLKNLQDDDSEDVVLDLLGYFILLRIATNKEVTEAHPASISRF